MVYQKTYIDRIAIRDRGSWAWMGTSMLFRALNGAADIDDCGRPLLADVFSPVIPFLHLSYPPKQVFSKRPRRIPVAFAVYFPRTVARHPWSTPFGQATFPSYPPTRLMTICHASHALSFTWCAPFTSNRTVANDNMTGHIGGTFPPATPHVQSPHLHLLILQALAQDSTAFVLRLSRIWRKRGL